MEENQMPVSNLPFYFIGDEEELYGEICYGELICPGVYYVFTKFDGLRIGGEYLVVTANSPAISSAARAFCIPLLVGNAVLCKKEYYDKGSHVIAYEAYKYLVEHNLPLPEGCSLKEEKIWGMEVCPEYFGEFPIPTETPWGIAVQHDRLENGLYWLRTEKVGWVLAIAYPFCSDMSEKAEDLAVLTDYDQRYGIENTLGYRFYTYETSCIPLFELIEYEDVLGGRVNIAALKNAVLKFYPDYAWDVTVGRVEGHIAIFANEIISETPGVGIDFYCFPKTEKEVAQWNKNAGR